MKSSRSIATASRTVATHIRPPRQSFVCQRWQSTQIPSRRLHQQSSRKAGEASATSPEPPIESSNPPLSFPCLDAIESRSQTLHRKSLLGGPEPSYTTGKHLTFHSKKPLLLDWGGVLPEYKIAYEAWGTLNKERNNAILLHTGLSASSHAHSTAENTKPGWWEKFIGSGKILDTDRYFVICTNVVGGCYGSTGPSSIDPKNGERYATRFPILTMEDMVRAQFRLLDNLGIERLYASVGSSMGGMQSLAAGVLFPERVGRIASISGCARSHPYSIAMRHTQRQGKSLQFLLPFHKLTVHSLDDGSQLASRFLLRHRHPTPRRHEARPRNSDRNLPKRSRMGSPLRAPPSRSITSTSPLSRLPDRNIPRPRGRKVVSRI